MKLTYIQNPNKLNNKKKQLKFSLPPLLLMQLLFRVIEPWLLLLKLVKCQKASHVEVIITESVSFTNSNKQVCLFYFVISVYLIDKLSKQFI